MLNYIPVCSECEKPYSMKNGIEGPDCACEAPKLNIPVFGETVLPDAAPRLKEED